MTQDYFVIWAIDVFDAESPEAAALKALEIQRKPRSWATMFQVVPHTGSVDLRIKLDKMEFVNLYEHALVMDQEGIPTTFAEVPLGEEFMTSDGEWYLKNQLGSAEYMLNKSQHDFGPHDVVAWKFND